MTDAAVAGLTSPGRPVFRTQSPRKAAELSQAADGIQLWLDDQWHQKFGRGLTDSSDTVDG